MKKLLTVLVFLLLSTNISALHSKTVSHISQHLERGFEYMLKPNQEMVVSIIKVNKEWHIVLVEGEELCPAFENVLDSVNLTSTTCGDIRFFIGQTEHGEEGIFTVLK